MAFFGDKYGDVVRVVRPGPISLEFCGGTHVDALGMIGPLAVVSEGSIGTNTRRIEAVTGPAAADRTLARETLLAEAASMLKVEPDGVLEALGRLLDRQRAQDREIARLRGSATDAEAASLAASAEGGVVVAPARRARSRRAADAGPGRAPATVCGRWWWAASPRRARWPSPRPPAGSLTPAALVKRVAKVVGGGGGGSPEVAVAGGRDPRRLDEALAEARRALSGE